MPQSELALLRKKIAAAANFNDLDDQEKIFLVSVYLFETSPPRTFTIFSGLEDKEKIFLVNIYLFKLSLEYTPEGLKELIQNSAEWIVRKTFPLIPEDCLDEELTIHLCNISRNFLSDLPAKFSNNIFYKKFIAQSQSDGNELYYIPPAFLTMKMVETVIQRTGKALRYVRSKYRTKEICKIAFNKDPEMIRYFPTEFITHKIATEAVEKNLDNIPYISIKFLTEDLVLQYLTRTSNRSPFKIYEENLDKDFALEMVEWIPRNLCTYKVLETIATFHPFELSEVPVNFLAEEILIAGASSSKSNHNFLFKTGKGDRKITWIPKKLLSIKLLQEAVFHDPVALKYLSIAKKKKIFSDPAFTIRFQQDSLANLYKKYPRDPLKFCLSCLPENVFSIDFFSDLLVTTFIKDIWVFKGQETLKSIPESLLSTDLLLKCLEKSALLLDKDKRLSEFIFAPISQANGLSYRSWVPAKLLTSDLLQKLVFLEPESLSILPKSSINKLVKDSAFIESLRAKYSRKKSVLKTIDDKLIRKVNP